MKSPLEGGVIPRREQHGANNESEAQGTGQSFHVKSHLRYDSTSSQLTTRSKLSF